MSFLDFIKNQKSSAAPSEPPAAPSEPDPIALQWIKAHHNMRNPYTRKLIPDNIKVFLKDEREKPHSVHQFRKEKYEIWRNIFLPNTKDDSHKKWLEIPEVHRRISGHFNVCLISKMCDWVRNNVDGYQDLLDIGNEILTGTSPILNTLLIQLLISKRKFSFNFLK